MSRTREDGRNAGQWIFNETKGRWLYEPPRPKARVALLAKMVGRKKPRAKKRGSKAAPRRAAV
jgi:hypothetical protein